MNSVSRKANGALAVGLLTSAEPNHLPGESQSQAKTERHWVAMSAAGDRQHRSSTHRSSKPFVRESTEEGGKALCNEMGSQQSVS